MDLTMREKLLPASYIIKDFVHGESNCNYESYLLELLNKSTWFSTKYPHGFYKPCSESHGECDAINQNYQIDFKLLASKTALQAKSILSFQTYKYADGVVGFKASRKKDTTIKATRLHAAFRNMSLVDIYNILENGEKAYGVENDILTALKMLETPKNLFLFFPYEFIFDEHHNDVSAVENISTALTEDFKVAFEYRDKRTQKQYDTFLTCIYDNFFLIFSVRNQILELIDMVKTREIKEFFRLGQYVDDLY